MTWAIHDSPLGPLTLEAGTHGLTSLRFRAPARALDERHHDPVALAAATDQLEQYFAGERQAFHVPLDLCGTPLEQRVWRELLRIDYGETIDYTSLAGRVGRPDRVRAVAAAVGRTPVPIIVPCHRVIGRNGSLTGYGGGLRRKAALLALERRGRRGLEPEPAWAFRQLALL